jgi:putative hemolysin
MLRCCAFWIFQIDDDDDDWIGFYIRPSRVNESSIASEQASERVGNVNRTSRYCLQSGARFAVSHRLCGFFVSFAFCFCVLLFVVLFSVLISVVRRWIDVCVGT